MKVWRLVAHHKNDIEAAQIYKDEGFIAVGWGHTGDLSLLGCSSHQEISDRILETQSKTHNAGSGGRILWGLLHEMSIGDQVIVSISGRRMQVMEITSDYYWESKEDEILMNYQHRRRAKQIDIDPDELWQRFTGVIDPWNVRWALGCCGELQDTLTRAEVAKIVGRYRSERPLFEQLASEIQRQTTERLWEKGIRNMVTARAKVPESLQKKLWKERARRKARDFEKALSPPLKDLAGVRVLLYLPEDTHPAVETLEELFQVHEKKSYAKKDAYRAEHLYVHLNDVEDNEGLKELLCEIQVCTITDHIWNELEHDIIYKQPGGQPDDGQKELLTSLHHMLGIASQAVDRLMKRTKKQIQKNSEPILEPDELQVYLSRRFGVVVRGTFDSLLELLKTLMAEVTPAELDKLFEDGWKKPKAQQEATIFDPNRSERDLGWISMMLLPVLGWHEIIDATERDDLPPLQNMMRRAAKKHLGGKA